VGGKWQGIKKITILPSPEQRLRGRVRRGAEKFKGQKMKMTYEAKGNQAVGADRPSTSDRDLRATPDY